SYLLGVRSEVDRMLGDEGRLRAGVDVSFESLVQEFEDPTEDRRARVVAEESVAGAPPRPDPAVPFEPASQMAAAQAAAMTGELPPQAAPVEPDTAPEPGDADFDLGFGDRIDFVGGAYADVVMDVAP